MGQEDTDGDGLGDACDECVLDPGNDADDDDLCGNEDNCPNVWNPWQDEGDDEQDRTLPPSLFGPDMSLRHVPQFPGGLMLRALEAALEAGGSDAVNKSGIPRSPDRRRVSNSSLTELKFCILNERAGDSTRSITCNIILCLGYVDVYDCDGHEISRDVSERNISEAL